MKEERLRALIVHQDIPIYLDKIIELLASKYISSKGALETGLFLYASGAILQAYPSNMKNFCTSASSECSDLIRKLEMASFFMNLTKLI